MRSAGRENQVIVRDPLLANYHGLLAGVDAGYGSKQHSRIKRIAKQAANGRGDIAGRNGRGCDLIQEWLKQVIVCAIDQGHCSAGTAQRHGAGQTGKAGADDDDSGQTLQRKSWLAIQFRKALSQPLVDDMIGRPRPAALHNQKRERHQKKDAIALRGVQHRPCTHRE